MKVSDKVKDVYGHKIRIRVCGILENEKSEILLINHSGLNESNEFWHLPGGGVNDLENIETALIREFKEECNLNVNILAYVNTYEYIKPPLHAIELIFKVSSSNFNIKKGFDPELDIINELKFMTLQEIKAIKKDNKADALASLL